MILDKLDRLPPCVCRLLARCRHGKGWRGLSHRELGQISKLPKSTIAELSFRKTWKGVAVDVVDAFAAACGVDHLRARRQITYLRTRSMTYTETGSIAQVKMYTRLLRLYAEITKAQQS
jgi:hypothetical protein